VEGASPRRFRIQDLQGRVLREIRAPNIEYVRYANLTGRGADGDLLVLAAPWHNTIGDIRLYAFSRAPRLRKILAMPEGYEELRDVDGDGRAEIILEAVYPFEWALGGHVSPTVAVVLKWEDGRYVIRTRRFAALARVGASWYRERFEQETAAIADLEVVPGERLYAIRVYAAGHWANRAALGEGNAALRWLAPKFLPGERRIFEENLGALRDGLRHLPGTIRTDQRRVIVRS
jgi:hypothetical protein